MPELPEVETYLRELEPELRQRRITDAQVYWPRTIAEPAATIFPQAVKEQLFTHFERRGKYMNFGLESGASLIVHLRMTGKLKIEAAAVAPGKHTHVVIALDDGRALHFQDPRKFGRIWLVQDAEQVLHKLGPEPLGASFTRHYLAEKLAGRQASIKSLLLDQSIVAGVGNIYADEALFEAAIHPAKPAGALEHEEIGLLRDAIMGVLVRAIEMRGSSLGDSNLQNYVRAGGESGGFQEEHRVFRRTGDPCRVCGAPIARIVLAQRSTHFCPVCQSG